MGQPPSDAAGRHIKSKIERGFPTIGDDDILQTVDHFNQLIGPERRSLLTSRLVLTSPWPGIEDRRRLGSARDQTRRSGSSHPSYCGIQPSG